MAAEIVADLPTFTLVQALGFAAVNLFQCLLAAWLLQRVARPFALDRLRHTVLFGAYVLVLACGLTALLGASIYSLSAPSATPFWAFWMIWWLGDGLGMLLVTPLLLGWLQGPSQPVEGHHLETMALLALTLLFTIWIFSQAVVITDDFPRRAFLLLPFPLWAAVRFGVRGAATIGLLLAVIAIVASIHGAGPLVAATPRSTVLLLQEYLAVLLLPPLALAALLEELKNRNDRLHIRERAIEAINDGVVIVDARTSDMRVVFSNPAFQANHAADYIPGGTLHLGDAVRAAMRDALEGGQPTEALLHERRQDGTEIWNDMRIAPVRDSRGQITHYVAIQHDMTEVKRNEAELRAARDELDHLNRELEARVEARTQELQQANLHLQ